MKKRNILQLRLTLSVMALLLLSCPSLCDTVRVFFPDGQFSRDGHGYNKDLLLPSGISIQTI
ncbi:MAG: hypothetical protein P1P86_04285 [Bacteroidales bacterium]|nr:hypothetical protein [Bacteroidales bacterium]